MFRSGENFSAIHSQSFGRQTPSATQQFIPDANDLQVYRSPRWLGLLNETDAYRRQGALLLAEKQYLDLLAKVRQAQGQNAVDAGWMLDHLGDFYLDAHDFDKAYQYFSDAIAIRRDNIQTLVPLAVPGKQESINLLFICRAHLIKMLVLVARLDAAKGDFALADRKLQEAVALGNKMVRLQDGLDAIYFRSQILEKQGRWQEAEDLWKDALQARVKMTVSDPYWDLVKEMAAFYARHSDFHSAAALVKRIQTETAGKTLRPVMAIPESLEERQGRKPDNDFIAGMYKSESAIAMDEILAVDRWTADGPDAAAPLFDAPNLARTSNEENMLFGLGSDSRQARFLSFLMQRAFLHMSVLLDGTPPPQRVVKAYAAIQPLKGAYLDSIAALTRAAESVRDNPNVSSINAIDPKIMIDELAKERTRHAHVFVAAALDGKPFDRMGFSASETEQESFSQGLAYSLRFGVDHRRPMDPSPLVPPNTAFIDIAAWDRVDRGAPAGPHREYGAFVFRKDQPPQYVRLAAADEIDRDVAALESVAVGAQVRGTQANRPSQPASASEIGRHLKRLYQEVVAPLEGSLNGVNTLLIVPDGKLTLVPIAAFVNPQGQYLLERYTVSYLGSWRDLGGSTTIRDDSPERTKVRPPVVVADPDFDAVLAGSTTPAPPARLRFEQLPSARLEASDVQTALKVAPDRVLTGRAAREESIRAAGGPEILHFATHSVPYIGWKIPTPAYDLFEYPRSLATEDPLLQSVIVLAGGNRPQSGPEDGLLTGLEVASLRLLGTRLVVLSTCEAGQGTPVDGQGVLGLRAAFAIAGAKGLVMSLWPVNDKAGRQFMQLFYSHLEAGPAAAVRMAQLEMISKTPYKDPIYWAGYAYSGEPASIAPSPSLSPETKTTVTKSTPPSSNGELLAAPACLQIESHYDSGNWTHIQTHRLKIAGAVRVLSQSREQITYQLLPPASDLEESDAISVNHGPPNQNPEVKIASRSGFSVSLTVEITKDHSAVYIREYVPQGHPRYSPQTISTITLRGGPALFPSLVVPRTFPPVTSYSVATVEEGKEVRKIDEAVACSAPF